MKYCDTRFILMLPYIFPHKGSEQDSEFNDESAQQWQPHYSPNSSYCWA
jgi:hypothetical protein